MNLETSIKLDSAPRGMNEKSAPKCRFCQAELRDVLVDLGSAPLANAMLDEASLTRMEPHFPLKVFVCTSCWLAQLEAYERPEVIFRDYTYFSSISSSWLAHARAFAAVATERFGLNTRSQVVEVASNDGYLLRHFAERGIPVLGIEPAANVAEAAEACGVRTLVDFFGRDMAARLAGEGRAADLIIANNVLAHVPDINDFVAGFKLLLKPKGVATFEFPHLLRLLDEVQFDTIYHEHYSYLSLVFAERLFAAHGLRVFDVDTLPTHGGSLRLYVCHAENAKWPESKALDELRALEEREGMGRSERYSGFQQQVNRVKRNVLRFLIDADDEGKTVAGYGAPAKGNTLLNFCGIGPDLLPYTVDLSPHKQGRYLPGTRIPVHAPRQIDVAKPDYVLILPWNLRSEIAEQMAHIRSWGGRFVIAIPRTEVF